MQGRFVVGFVSKDPRRSSCWCDGVQPVARTVGETGGILQYPAEHTTVLRAPRASNMTMPCVLRAPTVVSSHDGCRFMVYTCLPNGEPDKASLKVQLYSRAKTMRQVNCCIRLP